MDDRQRRMRVECHLAASVGAPDGERLHGWVRNLSLGGMFVETDGRLPVGSRCEIALLLHDGEDDRAGHALGEVVRVDDDGMAVQFLRMSPADDAAVNRTVTDHARAPKSG
jgi:c-di-GMP-binding flagellar brake protein YcgR